MKKILYIVLDGLGDVPSKDLNDKTPLESASTANMDRLAKEGKTGLVYTVDKGVAPESDIAVISILGYDAERYYTGRGPLECYAEGLEVCDGDLAYRVNFATLGEGNKIRDRRVGRSLTTQEAAILSREINDRVRLTLVPATFKFKNTIGHRGVLVISAQAGRLSGNITNTDPAYGREGIFGVANAVFENVLLECKPLDSYQNSKEAQNGAILTNEFIRKSHEVLDKSEVNKKRVASDNPSANVILTRDGGDRLPRFPTIGEQYGIKFGCFVEMPVERGIAMLTGMEIVELPQPTGNCREDYILRANMVVETMKRFDGLYIHIKGPDEPAHDGRVHDKRDIIQLIDEYFFSHVLSSIDIRNVIIAVTSDHSTLCSLKAHSDDPVPLLISGGDILPDSVVSFSERACKDGEFGTIMGIQLMPMLVEFAK